MHTHTHTHTHICSFFDTEWESDSILHGSSTLSRLPNSLLVGGATATGAVLTKAPSKAHILKCHNKGLLYSRLY